MTSMKELDDSVEVSAKVSILCDQIIHIQTIHGCVPISFSTSKP